MRLKDLKSGKLYRFVTKNENFHYPVYSEEESKRLFSLRKNDVFLCIENQLFSFGSCCKILFKDQVGKIFWSNPKGGDEDLWEEA